MIDKLGFDYDKEYQTEFVIVFKNLNNIIWDSLVKDGVTELWGKSKRIILIIH